MSFASSRRATHVPAWLRVVGQNSAGEAGCIDEAKRTLTGCRREADMARLPSLETLRIFAVAARHLSFTRAADELHLTQSAVSHRVRALEDELGIPLFKRMMRRLELTRAGQALAQRMDQAVADIARTIAELGTDRAAQHLTVTLLPSVAARWLVPRLPDFHARNPDIQLQLVTDPRLLD